MIGESIGNYTVVRRLGSGGMGEVWEAQQPAIGARVAVKVLNADAHDPQSERRFLIEAQAVNRIGHDGVVKVLDAGYTTDGRPYLVMEYLDGASLAEVMRGDARLPMGSACRVIADVLGVLAAAHEVGIVHRDLKPHNVFITKSGRTVVLDFGVAKLLDSTAAVSLTLTGAIVGTPAYMAPEQIQGEAVDGRADLYAVGVVLYELVCGRRPFDNDATFELLSSHVERRPPPPRAIRPDVPAGVQSVLMAALAKRPEDRFQTADAMRTALLQAAAELAPAAFAPIELPAATARRAGTSPPRRPTGPPAMRSAPNAPPPSASTSGPELAASTVPMRAPTGPARAVAQAAAKARTGPSARVGSGAVPRVRDAAELALAVTAPESPTVPEPAASRPGLSAAPASASLRPPRSRRPLAIALGVGLVGAAGIAYAIGRSLGDGSAPAAAPAPVVTPGSAGPARPDAPPAVSLEAPAVIPRPVAEKLFARKLHVLDLEPGLVEQLIALERADGPAIEAAVPALVEAVNRTSAARPLFFDKKLARIEARFPRATLSPRDLDAARDLVELARDLLEGRDPSVLDTLDANEHLWRAEWLLEHGARAPRRLP
jgi:hypothetical protein